jgi:SAM-dependent methyltransferase
MKQDICLSNPHAAGMTRLNLGCGDRIYPGYLNVDRVRLPGVDLTLNLERLLPFSDNSIKEIRAEHILEHVHNFMQLMEEIHRVCRHGARIYVLAPYYKYEGTYRDPTHVRFFTEHSFDYFQEGVKFSHISKARFKVIRVKKRVRFLSSVKNTQKTIMRLTPDFLRPLLDIFFWNIYSELVYELRVVK